MTTGQNASKPKVLLLENIHPRAVEHFESLGYDVSTHPAAMTEDELVAALPGVNLLGIRSNTHLSRAVFANAPDLMGVGAFCIGTNQIDLAAAAERGIPVFNAPYSNTRSVVELVIGEIIALARRIPEKNQNMHNGIWDKSARGSHEVRGRVLGIVGYGNIGAQLSVLAESLGFSVIFYDIADKLALGNARRVGTLDELLAQADTVSLHVDGRPGNAGIFGAEQFAKMKPRAMFINASRGMVVDHLALRDAVLSGHISGAAVDVFPVEPKKPGEEFISELRGLPNVILTPHVGGSTQEAQEDIGRFVSGKLSAYVEDGATSLSVNLPTIEVSPREDVHRLIHVHQNVPGVIAEINRILADHGQNVESQSLTTRGDLGYVVTDVNGAISPQAVGELEAMPHTIRLRVLS
ncbi:phosphoglycerate dehydrogenase [Blastococcus sp. Marseille-P5729]|uniref:phosphoglycerate dehydrogenase n=1 Tax=Blastococcus sp. Marseille-P5729 TaxID=2086582 RepID=UPI001F3D0E9B|nr:phosphoglycerate dehydrogenase [Blastococcus sp. Marseille-P5729]